MERKFILLLILNIFLSACDDEKRDSVRLSGSIIDVSTQNAPDDALVSYKVGNQWSGKLEATNGEFLIASLPGNSDVTLLIESESGAFMPQEISSRTYSTDDGVNYQNLPLIEVSPSVTYTFSVLDIESKETITDLKFTSSVFADSYYNQMYYESTFNQSTKLYSITFPRYKYEPIFNASLDVNRDGKNEYSLYNYCCGDNLTIDSDYFKSSDTLYLSKAEEYKQQELTFRITVLDDNLNKIDGAKLSVIDKLNDVESIFNSELEQHVIKAQILQTLQIHLPAFELENNFYRSNVVTVTVENDNTLIIESESDVNQFENTYSVDYSADGIDMVVYTTKVDSINENNLSLVAKSDFVDLEDYTYKFFFSVPIDVVNTELGLVQLDKLITIKGNDSDSDLVFPGYTLFEKTDVKTEVDFKLSLNDTLLVLKPKIQINTEEKFRFNLNKVKEKFTGSELILNESQEFESIFKFSNTTLFDINSLVLDNNNYQVNQNNIVEENTGGVPADTGSNHDYANLYYPAEIHLLKNFTLKKSIVTENGFATYTNELIEVVTDGSILANEVYTVSLANNEDIINRSGYDIHRGTSLSDGKYWSHSQIEYMPDDTDSETNDITFEYSYETLTGEIYTGTVRLEVQ